MVLSSPQHKPVHLLRESRHMKHKGLESIVRMQADNAQISHMESIVRAQDPRIDVVPSTIVSQHVLQRKAHATSVARILGFELLCSFPVHDAEVIATACHSVDGAGQIVGLGIYCPLGPVKDPTFCLKTSHKLQEHADFRRRQWHTASIQDAFAQGETP